MDRPDLLRRSLAEGLAVFALVVAGCGATVGTGVVTGGGGASAASANGASGRRTSSTAEPPLRGARMRRPSSAHTT
jgi:hypothetical protein